jgi:hypothetical protein
MFRLIFASGVVLAMSLGQVIFRVPQDGGGSESSTTLCTDAGANARFVKTASSGTGSGTSWTNAMAFPSSPTRGLTYCVSDGAYGNVTLNANTSGTTTITIVKATTTDHGATANGGDDGWVSTMGNGQATFGSFLHDDGSDYWIIDGAFRDEDDWSDETAYGIQMSSILSSGLGGSLSHHNVYRNVAVRGVYHDGDCVYLSGFSNPGATFWTFSKVNIEECSLIFQMAGASDILIEDSWMERAHQKEMIRGQVYTSRITIRRNVFKNGCRDELSGEGCTAQIAIWGATGNPGTAGSFDNIEIYGNLFWRNIGQGNSDACIMLGGDGGSTAEGPATRNSLVFNNTIVDDGTGPCTIRLNGSGTGNIVRNNLWYVTGGMSTGCSGTSTCDNNSVYTSSPPFVSSNLTTLDAHLTGALAGSATGSPAGNATDIDGVTRTTPDRGAYEFP